MAGILAVTSGVTDPLPSPAAERTVVAGASAGTAPDTGERTAAVRFAFQPTVQTQATVKIATVHFAPTEGDVAGNRARLVALATEAA